MCVCVCVCVCVCGGGGVRILPWIRFFVIFTCSVFLSAGLAAEIKHDIHPSCVEREKRYFKNGHEVKHFKDCALTLRQVRLYVSICIKYILLYGTDINTSFSYDFSLRDTFCLFLILILFSI